MLTEFNDNKVKYYLFLSIMALMSAVGLFATDIYLPALPEMTLYFNCSQTEIQSSFTTFLLGLAVCQLVAGVLADRFGRKRVVLSGLVLFISASILCAYATNLTEFILCRLLQAMGGGVGSVVSRAIVANRFDRQGSAKAFSTIFPVVGLSSAIAPLIGGYLTYFFSWRSTFFFMAGFGVVVLLMVIFYLKNADVKRTIALDEQKPTRIQGYLGIVRNVEFLGYALILCAAFSVFRSYTVESPFVFNNQGYGVNEIGYFYITLSLAYLMGNLTAKKLVNTRSVEKVLKVGLMIFALGGFSMIAASLMFGDNPYAIILPMAMITLGNGFLFPISSAGALTAVPGAFSGTASGLMGAIQFTMAAFCVHWVGDLCQGQALQMAVFIGTIILIGLLSYFLLIVYRPKTRVTI